MRMTPQPGKATHGPGVRDTCSTCKGAVATFAPKDARIHAQQQLCPVCQKRPELAGVVSRMPTQSYLDHAKTCKVCRMPDTFCDVGLAAQKEHPGHWSTPAPTAK